MTPTAVQISHCREWLRVFAYRRKTIFRGRGPGEATYVPAGAFVEAARLEGFSTVPALAKWARTAPPSFPAATMTQRWITRAVLQGQRGALLRQLAQVERELAAVERDDPAVAVERGLLLEMTRKICPGFTSDNDEPLDRLRERVVAFWGPMSCTEVEEVESFARGVRAGLFA